MIPGKALHRLNRVETIQFLSTVLRAKLASLMFAPGGNLTLLHWYGLATCLEQPKRHRCVLEWSTLTYSNTSLLVEPTQCVLTAVAS
jgi:hypothetical protein